MALAVGWVGLSLSDFERLTLGELTQIVDAWRAQRQAEEYESWHRVRVLGCMILQPWVSETLDPYRVLPLAGDAETGTRHRVSEEEARERFRRIMQRR